MGFQQTLQYIMMYLKVLSKSIVTFRSAEIFIFCLFLVVNLSETEYDFNIWRTYIFNN